MPRRPGGTTALASAAGPAPSLLSWPGVALPPLRLLGSWIAPVVRVDHAAHRDRVASGDGPQFDQDTLAVWEWPESAGQAPSSVLELAGVIVWATSWRSGLTDAKGWRGFGPSAVASRPATVERVGELGALEFELGGVGLVEYNMAARVRAVILAAPGRVATARRRVLDRWVEESLYRHALAVGMLTEETA